MIRRWPMSCQAAANRRWGITWSGAGVAQAATMAICGCLVGCRPPLNSTPRSPGEAQGGNFGFFVSRSFFRRRNLRASCCSGIAPWLFTRFGNQGCLRPRVSLSMMTTGAYTTSPGHCASVRGGPPWRSRDRDFQNFINIEEALVATRLWSPGQTSQSRLVGPWSHII